MTRRERERANSFCEQKGMPLGNLTSQFFANVYLNELDYFIKRILKVKYYIRYVDDFIILDNSKEQLERWKEEIRIFIKEHLKLDLHPSKSNIYSLSEVIDFVGFRNYYYFKIPRKRNIRKMLKRIDKFSEGQIPYLRLMKSFEGWNAYVKWSNSYNIRKDILKAIQIARKKTKSSKLTLEEYLH